MLMLKRGPAECTHTRGDGSLQDPATRRLRGSLDFPREGIGALHLINLLLHECDKVFADDQMIRVLVEPVHDEARRAARDVLVVNVQDVLLHRRVRGDERAGADLDGHQGRKRQLHASAQRSGQTLWQDWRRVLPHNLLLRVAARGVFITQDGRCVKPLHGLGY